MILERRAGRRQAREDETAILIDTWNRREPVVLLAKRDVVTTGVGHADQLAAIVVGPAVIGAAEGVGVAALALTDGVAAMHAAVEHQMNRAVLVARDDYGLRTDSAHDVVARLGNFARMSDVNPLAMPDFVELVVEDRTVVIDASVDAIVADQIIVSDLVLALRIDSRIRHRRHGRHLAGFQPDPTV